LQGLTQMISIKSLVSQQCTECQAFNQIRHADDLSALTGKKIETHEIAQGIREGEHFGRQSAF
jgi:hypothetical protein